jgi:hypothetical protein
MRVRFTPAGIALPHHERSRPAAPLLHAPAPGCVFSSRKDPPGNPPATGTDRPWP